MTFNEFKQLVIAECAAKGIEEYELYYQAGSSVSVDTFQHSINEFTSSYSGGLCFRCIYGGKMGYASTEALEESQAKALVEKAVDNAANLEAEEQAAWLNVFLSGPSPLVFALDDRNVLFLIAFSERGLEETALWLQRAVSPRMIFLSSLMPAARWWP